MRRVTFITLAFLTVQLLGVKAFCAPSQTPSHACCPSSATDHYSPSPTSAPPCCAISPLAVEGVADGFDSASRSTEYLHANLEAVRPFTFVPAFVAADDPRIRGALPIPPRSPRSQTCLLLI
jgi:hypothetical protein